MPRPRRAATALLQAACVHARALAACPQGHASVPTQACHGLGCVPWPWLRAHASMPWPMGAAMALALAACTQACLGLGCLPMGAALALAAACPGLGCMPVGGCLGLRCMPWAFAAACPHISSDFLKMRVFWKMRLFPPRRQVEAGSGHARVHAVPHRPASSRTPEKLARAFFHFCIPKFIP